MPISIVVLASGSGSLFQALIDATHRNQAYEIRALVTDRPDAAVVQRAVSAGIEVVMLPLSDFTNRQEWNHAIADAVDYFNPGLVVSAGFMRVLSEPILTKYKNRIINTHPALLPNFPGAHAVRDALAAGVSETGCTVHYVDAGVDTGPVISQQVVRIEPGDDETSLHERIKVVEREMLVDVLVSLNSRQKLEGKN